MRRVLAAIFALDGKVRIAPGKVPSSTGVRVCPLQLRVYIAATGMRIVGEYEIARSRNRPGRGSPGCRRLAEKLAMRRVAEIELVMTIPAGDEVRTGRQWLELSAPRTEYLAHFLRPRSMPRRFRGPSYDDAGQAFRRKV